MNIPSVSVVIPAYNSAAPLREAVESVFGQTYQDFEILVVDDGSTDDTESVARSFGNRIVYLKQENRGAGAARNHGIRKAQGRYVAFLDSDDLWCPSKLAEQIPLLDRDPEIGLVYSDWAVRSQDREVNPSYLKDLSPASGYVFEALVQSGFILTSGTVVRRSCLEEVGYFDEGLSVGEDLDLWLRICYRWKVGFVNKPLLTKRNRNGNLSSDLEKTAVERIVLFRKTLRTFQDMPRSSQRLVRHQVALSYWDVGYHHFDRMLLKEARRNFLSGLRFQWTHTRSLGYLAASCLPASLLKTIRAIKRAVP